MSVIDNDWLPFMSAEFGKEYYKKLYSFIVKEYQSQTVYPPKDDVLRAFNLTPLSEVKVVILGQDPYHEPNQAHGLCFSVNDGVQFPPSLQNIFKEIEAETGAPIPQSGNLTRWAQQGVFLLNTCLSVREHQAFSHSGHGWETFTDAVISTLSREREGLVFMLWGAPAGKKAALIDANKHCILRSAHPSPLSAYRGFFGNNHFNLCNQYLQAHGQQPIQW